MYCIRARTPYIHTNTRQLTAAHMFRRRLMEGVTRGKGWTGVKQGLARMPPTLSAQTHSPFSCNIYNSMHMLNQVGQLQLFATQGSERTDRRRHEGKQNVTGKVRRATAPLDAEAVGHQNDSPVVLLLQSLSYFTDLVKMTCLHRKNKKVTQHFSLVGVHSLYPHF